MIYALEQITGILKYDKYLKHELDITHQERIERGTRDNVRVLYDSKQDERDEDCRKLSQFIKDNDE